MRTYTVQLRDKNDVFLRYISLNQALDVDIRGEVELVIGKGTWRYHHVLAVKLLPHASSQWAVRSSGGFATLQMVPQ